MRNFLAKFMYGRYGLDPLSKFMMILWFATAAVNIALKSNILYALSMIPAFLFFFRVLSRNTAKRRAENVKFQAIAGKITLWLKFRLQKLREIKTHRYIRCPGCHAVLRFPRRTGKHTAVCPKCKNRFETRIIL